MNPATVSTVTAARQLGTGYRTLHRHVRRWHPPVGKGNRLRLTDIDVMVCRAFAAINGTGPQAASANPLAGRLRALAESAIRTQPARWLVLSVDHAATYATIDAAALAVADEPRCRHWVIDLTPETPTGAEVER